MSEDWLDITNVETSRGHAVMCKPVGLSAVTVAPSKQLPESRQEAPLPIPAGILSKYGVSVKNRLIHILDLHRLVILNIDSQVDFFDLAILAEHWMEEE